MIISSAIAAKFEKCKVKNNCFSLYSIYKATHINFNCSFDRCFTECGSVKILNTLYPNKEA